MAVPPVPGPAAPLGPQRRIVRHEVRPGRPYAVPMSLAELSGPTEGVVRLPRHLDCGPDYGYDLGGSGPNSQTGARSSGNLGERLLTGTETRFIHMDAGALALAPASEG